MGKLSLDNIAGIAGETIKLLILIVTGIVLLDRVKNATRGLKMRVAALEHWRDEHISSIHPHTVCILEDRRKIATTSAGLRTGGFVTLFPRV